jgi:hypothetical protein
MSVNVDFDIRVTGFGANKDAVVTQVAELLAGEGLLDQLAKKDRKDEVAFASRIPIIIAKSYVYLPELAKALGTLAKGGVAIELRTRLEGGRWETSGKKEKKRAKAKARAKATKTSTKTKTKTRAKT